MKRLVAFVLIMSSAAAAACGGGDAVAVPTVGPVAVTATPAPVETSAVAPTPAQEATLPPPLVASPVPTSTPEPTSAALVLDSPEDFGNDRNPLTGEVVADPAVLQRRPVAVKVSNAPPNFVRPQSGLNAADLVFEHITEAVVTRFTAIFYSEDPAAVGPIRSARLIDVELPAMYDAGLAYSGCSVGVCRKLGNSDFASRLIRSDADGYYRTGDTTKPFEHTLYADPARLREALGAENRPPQFGERMAFSSEPPPGGSPAEKITLNYKYEDVVWTYDAATGHYLRSAAGVPHLDALTGEQISATNVVVAFANQVDDPTICEQISSAGTCQLLSVEIQLWGEGRVVVFRDGLMFEGTWRRANRNDMLTFYDAGGNEIPLQIGNTWVQLMSIYYADSLTVE